MPQHLRVLIFNEVGLGFQFLLLTFCLLVVSALVLGRLVNVVVVSHEVPLAGHHEVALEVDKHDQEQQVPDDSSEDTNILWIACRPTELLKSNDEVDSADKKFWLYVLFLTIPEAKDRR